MVSENNKKQVFAAVAGIVVGAGAASAGAVALSDKNNQKKVSDALDKGKRMVKGYVNDANDKASDVKEKVEDTMDSGKVKARKLANVVKTAGNGVKNL